MGMTREEADNASAALEVIRARRAGEAGVTTTAMNSALRTVNGVISSYARRVNATKPSEKVARLRTQLLGD